MFLIMSVRYHHIKLKYHSKLQQNALLVTLKALGGNSGVKDVVYCRGVAGFYGHASTVEKLQRRGTFL